MVSENAVGFLHSPANTIAVMAIQSCSDSRFWQPKKKKSSKAELNNSILLLKAQTQLYRKKGKLGG